MIKYSPNKYSPTGNGSCRRCDKSGDKLVYGNLTWSAYQTNFDKALDRGMETQPTGCCEGGSAAGFKLMYNQIPPSFVEQFIEHVINRGIAIVHLVREATVLRIASQKQSRSRIMHTTNSSVVAQTSKVDLMSWDATTISQVRALESQDTSWQRRLAFQPGLRYHHISYENLLSLKSREDKLGQVTAFLKPFHVPLPVGLVLVNGTLLQRHNPRCSLRIKNYAKLRSELEGTRTASACDMLEKAFQK